MVWARADGTHYPGTYLAGGYDRLRTEIAGRTTENEELVNLPNWLALDFRIGDQDWFDEKNTTLVDYRQELDLRRGLLLRTVRFEDRKRPAHSVAGATPCLDGRYAPGCAGGDDNGRELVGPDHRSVRH